MPRCRWTDYNSKGNTCLFLSAKNRNLRLQTASPKFWCCHLIARLNSYMNKQVFFLKWTMSVFTCHVIWILENWSEIILHCWAGSVIYTNETAVSKVFLSRHHAKIGPISWLQAQVIHLASCRIYPWQSDLSS